MAQEQAPLERMTTTRSPRWRASGRSRGQALVEFALVAPLFLMLLFGVIEYSLINASIGAYNFAAKDAAREGAILGKGGVPGPGGTTTPADNYMVNNIILPHVSGVVIAQMTKIEIFHASETGACISTTGSGGAQVCQEDIWQQSGGTWSSTSSNWPQTTRNDALANADYIGVKISYTYTYLTALLAITTPTISLTATSVQRIEPQEYGQGQPHQEWATVSPVWAITEPQQNVSGGRA